MSDKGKCTKCRFVKDDFCNVGSYYAEEFGTNSVCFEGELWEAIEKLPTTNKVQKCPNCGGDPIQKVGINKHCEYCDFYW